MVKHAFGLRTQARKLPVRAYIYPEPQAWPPTAGKLIGNEERAQHAEEVRWFARRTRERSPVSALCVSGNSSTGAYKRIIQQHEFRLAVAFERRESTYNAPTRGWLRRFESRVQFKVGDHVTWNSEAGHVSGKIIKVHTKNVVYKGYTHQANADEPQYEIEGDKTDHIAIHKGSALQKARG